MSERLKLGLDFGTSNSAVGSVVDDEVKVFDAHEDRKTQPSSIFIRVDGYYSTGYRAIEDFVDPATKTDAYHFIPSVKPGLPLEYYDGNVLRSTKLQEGRYPARFFPVEDLASFVITDLKEKAEVQAGETSSRVVLGRPVVFSEDKKLDKLAQTRLEEAARIAGFKEVHFVLEPIAAALYYERTKLGSEPKKAFVFDFGGGTLDTCVLELRPNERIDPDKLKSRVLASHGVELGGTDIDKDIFEKFFLPYFGENVTHGEQGLGMPRYIFADLPEWHLASQLDKPNIMEFLGRVAADMHASDKDAIKRLITLIKDQQVFALLQSIESAKIDISSDESSSIDHHYQNIQISRPITRSEFERAIASRKRQTEACIQECLSRAELHASDIDLVLRVGGSSSNIFVGNMLREMFDTVEDTEPLTSVVAGLSLVADELFE